MSYSRKLKYVMTEDDKKLAEIIKGNFKHEKPIVPCPAFRLDVFTYIYKAELSADLADEFCKLIFEADVNRVCELLGGYILPEEVTKWVMYVSCYPYVPVGDPNSIVNVSLTVEGKDEVWVDCPRRTVKIATKRHEAVWSGIKDEIIIPR